MTDIEQPYTPSLESARSVYAWLQGPKKAAERGEAFDRMIEAVRAEERNAFVNGAKWANSRGPASPAPREAVARWACEYMGDPDEMASDYFEFADALLAAFTITEKGAGS